MQPHEVLLNVHIPFTKEHDFIREYKQAHRRDDDIAIANAGMRVRMEMGPQGKASYGELPSAIASDHGSPLQMAPGSTCRMHSIPCITISPKRVHVVASVIGWRFVQLSSSAFP